MDLLLSINNNNNKQYITEPYNQYSLHIGIFLEIIAHTSTTIIPNVQNRSDIFNFFVRIPNPPPNRTSTDTHPNILPVNTNNKKAPQILKIAFEFLLLKKQNICTKIDPQKI